MGTVGPRYVDTTVGRIHAVAYEGGEPIVLLHQGLRSGESFRRLAPLLAPGLATIAVDLPGCGGSDPAAGDVTVAQLAECVVCVLDDLGIERAHLFGNHTGATVAAEIAAGWPDRVDGLALFGFALVTSEQERRSEVDNRVHELGQFLSVSADGSHLSRWWSWLRLQVSFQRFTAGIVPSDTYTDIELGFMTTCFTDLVRSAKTFTSIYRAVFEYEAVSRLPFVQAPTLAIDGTGPFEPKIVQRSEQLAALIPDCEARTMVGEDGNLIWWKPEAIADVLAGFLNPR